MGQYRNRKIHQIDPDTGAVLRTIKSDRFVTGVQAGSRASSGTPRPKATRAIYAASTRKPEDVLEKLEMPPGVSVSGLKS